MTRKRGGPRARLLLAPVVVVAHNLCVLVEAHHELGIDPVLTA